MWRTYYAFKCSAAGTQGWWSLHRGDGDGLLVHSVTLSLTAGNKVTDAGRGREQGAVVVTETVANGDSGVHLRYLITFSTCLTILALGGLACRPRVGTTGVIPGVSRVDLQSPVNYENGSTFPADRVLVKQLGLFLRAVAR